MEYNIYLKRAETILEQRNPALFQLSLACCLKALELDPDNPKAYNKAGKLFKLLGNQPEALRSIRKALELDPGFTPARFELLHALLPILYEEETGISGARLAYQRQLSQLSRDIRLDRPQSISRAAQAVGRYPFHLAYQGYNDVALQRSYGQLVCRIQAAKYPQWSRCLPAPDMTRRRPVKLGIVSGFFHYHSNWKMRISGWLEQLDRERVEIYGYYTGKHPDDCTARARQLCAAFRENDFSVRGLSRSILADKPDVLIYPEIGMNRLAVKLSALRLAPVQCTTWGHPTTSGLPTMDYFLSSDLMEPPEAQDHYTETLVRLPNLSVYYSPPLAPGNPCADRRELGLEPGSVLYLCVQSLFKYLPQYDDVFPRIAKQMAKQTGNCRFVFLRGYLSTPLVKLFKHRLERAFARYNLDSGQYISVLPLLDGEKYFALNQVADIFLDAIGWSGCNSTLEAIDAGLPVVTLPGKMMRGRHSMAFLKMMGVTQTIAHSLNDYVNIAARLGQDSQWRGHIRERIDQNKHKLYRDMDSIEGLETFLETAVHNAAVHNAAGPSTEDPVC